MRTISHFINGQSVTGTGSVTSPVYDPSTGQVQARLEHGDPAILAEAVAVAKAAQPAWAATNPQYRARVIFKSKALIEDHRQELIRLMSSEHGKMLDDSMGELQRGLDVVEFICGVPHLQKGEFTQGAGPGMNVYSIREPLGVVAGIPARSDFRATILKGSVRELQSLGKFEGLPDPLFRLRMPQCRAMS